MIPASIFAEALRNNETLPQSRERLSTHAHVARHYRDVALPALAGALRRKSHSGQKSSSQPGTKSPGSGYCLHNAN